MDIISFIFFLLFMFAVILLFIMITKGVTFFTIGALVILIIIFLLLDYIVRLSREIEPATIENKPEAPWDFIGGLCEVLDEITPVKSGFVRYRGELWQAYSVKESFRPGEKAYVVDARGIYLLISREPPRRSVDK